MLVKDGDILKQANSNTQAVFVCVRNVILAIPQQCVNFIAIPQQFVNFIEPT